MKGHHVSILNCNDFPGRVLDHLKADILGIPASRTLLAEKGIQKLVPSWTCNVEFVGF